MSIARVALDVPLDKLFDYLAPELTREDIGLRVLVPFGKKQMVGVVVDVAEKSDIAPQRLKRITSVYRDVPALTSHLMNLFRFCADYYHYPLGQVILNGLPKYLRRKKQVSRKSSCVFCLTDAGWQLPPEALPTKALVKRKLLERLRSGTLNREELRKISPAAAKALNDFIARGWVQEREEPSMASSLSASLPQLTAQQTRGAQSIQFDEFGCSLLFGVTGSGKTEIYFNLIAQTLAQNKQALLLVPEINLSPQLEDWLRQRFPGSRIVSLHSGLNDGARLENWLAAQCGEALVVLGTRLAVFTPMPRLGLIIVDEENDASFKQQEGLRYSARDVAVFRAKQANVPVLLGSATPALESYQHALTGRYRLVKLTQRAVETAELPRLSCIDMRHLKLREGLSEPLIGAIRQRLGRG